jgi:hypothetical protein
MLSDIDVMHLALRRQKQRALSISRLEEDVSLLISGSSSGSVSLIASLRGMASRPSKNPPKQVARLLVPKETDDGFSIIS